MPITFKRMYECIYVYMYVCMYVYVYTYVCMHVYMYEFAFVCMQVMLAVFQLPCLCNGRYGSNISVSPKYQRDPPVTIPFVITYLSHPLLSFPSFQKCSQRSLTRMEIVGRMGDRWRSALNYAIVDVL